MDKDEFLKTARKRYELCVAAEKDNRARAMEAIRFRNLEQWDDRVRRDRENDPEGARPCLVLDKLNQHIHQVVNDQRQNRPQIKVRPVDDKADPETAKIFDGIIRHIQDSSNADIAYDTAFEQTVDGGFGYFRILTDYIDERSFDQDIKIGRIRNRFSVYLDPNRMEPDGSDAQYGFIIDKMTKDAFEEEYPDADGEWPTDVYQDWYGDDWVMVAEYYWYEYEEVTLHLLENGAIVTAKEHEEQHPSTMIDTLAGPAQAGIVKSREAEIPKVKWAKITAIDILEQTDWAGKWIPIVEVVGNELDIEGKPYRSGLIRSAMDAQRVYNYAASAFVENVALAPRAPWVAADGQVEDYELEWNTANRRNLSVLRYKPMDVAGTPVPPPTRLPPPGVSTGWETALQNAEHDIESAVGRYAASLGAPSNEKSGRAITARQHEGDVGSFHFVDNLSRSLRHAGRILVDLIPKIYDTQRVARIIGEDGTPDSAHLDPSAPLAMQEKQNPFTGAVQTIYNPSVGMYDVTVVVGPAYTTRRLEAADSMMQLAQGNPQFLQTMGDLIFRNQDWPGSEQIADRFKMMLPPNLQEQDGKDAEKQQLQQQLMVLQQQLQMVEQQAMQQIQAAQADNGMKATELQIKQMEAQIKAFEAESERLQIIANAQAEEQRMAMEADRSQREAAMALMQPETQEDTQEQAALAEIGQRIEQLTCAIAQIQQQQQPIILPQQSSRKEITIQAPSGAVYTGIVEG